MKQLELPHLVTFLEAAERGSFTAAARYLGLTQAAVSQRIQQLETVLRTKLFRREAGRATPTAAGRRLHAYARQINNLTKKAVAAVTGAADVTEGELRLAASSVPGQYLLPATLAAFRTRHPFVQVRVAVSDTESVLRLVEHGEAHIGLVGGPGKSPQLEFQPYACDSLVVIVPAGYFWQRRKQITVRQLLDQPLIHREQGSGSRRCLEHSLERLGVHASELKVVLELGNSEAIKEAVSGGLGIAVMSSRSVEREVKAGQFKAIQVNGLTLDRDIFIVTRRRQVLPATARLFLSFVKPGRPHS